MPPNDTREPFEVLRKVSAVLNRRFVGPEWLPLIGRLGALLLLITFCGFAV